MKCSSSLCLHAESTTLQPSVTRSHGSALALRRDFCFHAAASGAATSLPALHSISPIAVGLAHEGSASPQHPCCSRVQPALLTSYCSTRQGTPTWPSTTTDTPHLACAGGSLGDLPEARARQPVGGRQLRAASIPAAVPAAERPGPWARRAAAVRAGLRSIRLHGPSPDRAGAACRQPGPSPGLCLHPQLACPGGPSHPLLAQAAGVTQDRRPPMRSMSGAVSGIAPCWCTSAPCAGPLRLVKSSDRHGESSTCAQRAQG